MQALPPTLSTRFPSGKLTASQAAPPAGPPPPSLQLKELWPDARAPPLSPEALGRPLSFLNKKLL